MQQIFFCFFSFSIELRFAACTVFHLASPFVSRMILAGGPLDFRVAGRRRTRILCSNGLERNLGSGTCSGRHPFSVFK